MQTAKRVLLVEDDADDQMFFVEALKSIHPLIKCDIAHNGEEALKMVSSSPYDFIFMDLNMPVMDGCTCLDKLKAGKYKKIPVIILTTSRNPKDIERCKNLGALMYCIKPDSYDALFKELKIILTEGRQPML